MKADNVAWKQILKIDLKIVIKNNNYFVYPKLFKLIKKFVDTETVFSKQPMNFLWYCEHKKFMGSFVNTESVPTIFLNHLEEFAINKIIIICRNILVDRYKLTSRPSTCPSLIGIITKCSKYLLWKPRNHFRCWHAMSQAWLYLS